MHLSVKATLVLPVVLHAACLFAAKIVLDADTSKISFVRFNSASAEEGGHEVSFINATTLPRMASRLTDLNRTLVEKLSDLNKMFYSLPCHVSCPNKEHCVGPLLRHCCKESEVLNAENRTCVAAPRGISFLK